MGQKPAKPTPIVQEKTPSVEEQIKYLEKRKINLETLINSNIKLARQALSKKDNVASQRYMKTVHRLRTELANIHAMIDKLDELHHTTQKMRMQKDVLNVTDKATNTLKQITIDPSRADEIMDNMQEAIENVTEVSEVFGKMTVSPSIEKELNDMMGEPEPVISIPTNLPEIPTHTIVVQPKTTLERELEAINV